MGTHPPHSWPEALCQTPQATQVPLEATQLEGRGLGSTARALQGLGWCRQLLPPPQAGACHKEQVTQEQLHGLGVEDRGQGGAPALGGEGGGPRCQGPAPGCTAEALHPPHTHAMQQQCTAGPPASPGLHTHHLPQEQPPRRALPPLTPPLLQGVGELKPDGATTLPWTQASAKSKASWAPSTVLSG